MGYGVRSNVVRSRMWGKETEKLRPSQGSNKVGVLEEEDGARKEI